MNDTYAVGAAVIAVDAVGFTLYLRWHFTPPKPGRHSKAGIKARWMEPVDVMDWFDAYCVVENRTTEHAQLRTGGALCFRCHNPLEGGRRR